MSLDSTLETFTFGNSSYIDVIAVCKDISFNFLSYSVFCSIFKSEFFPNLFAATPALSK